MSDAKAVLDKWRYARRDYNTPVDIDAAFDETWDALAAEVERRDEPPEARTLDDVVACAKRALLNLNAIPDGIYPPWDETITQAHLLLDDMGIGSLEEQLAHQH